MKAIKISITEELLKVADEVVEVEGLYASRSEFIRALIRRFKKEQQAESLRVMETMIR